MSRRVSLTVLVLALVPTSAALAHGPDGITLQVNPGPGPEVALDWTGGQPLFEVFRSTDPATVIGPPNKLGDTDVRSWVDAPPPATILYYQIASPCVYSPPEVCDGVDNDCDGTVDGAPAVASCDDFDGCTFDGCSSGVCTNVARDACPEPVCGLPGCGFTDGDGDGLNDTWETNDYIDTNCNGSNDAGIDTPLPAADPLIPDIYVKYDYMELTGTGAPCLTPADCVPAGQQCVASVCTGHSHAPSMTAIQRVIDAFAVRGIALHVDPFPGALPHHAVVTTEPLPPTCTGPDAVSFYDVKAANFPTHLEPAYHYALFSHYTHCRTPSECATCPPLAGGSQPEFGTSGIAERPGNDFMVSFGAFVDNTLLVTDDMVAGTFMHELGHNLNLRHGGGDDLRQKPNYFSVMNPSYQFGIPMSAAPGPYPTSPVNPAVEYRIDFSDRALDPLQEPGVPGMAGGLDEVVGVSGLPSSRDVTVFWAEPGPMLLYAPSNGTPIDWNNNALPGEPHVVADVSGDGGLDVLSGFNDWAPAPGPPPTPGLYLQFQCNTGYWADGVTELDFETSLLGSMVCPAKECQAPR